MTRIFTAASAVLITALVFFAPASFAAEGMWTLDNPPTKAMQADLGWAPDRAWLDRAMHGSARIAGGCSASFVSKNGLVLTNHHCVAGCVGQLSTGTSDLMKTGFLAKTLSEERVCPAFEINRLEQMTDVTADVKNAGAGLAGNAFKSAQDAAKAKLTSACGGGNDAVLCEVVDLYHGGQYKLYRYHRFKDVRLVFAPEEAIAAFGGDPDNFNFPRYDLDMAIVRIYENGKPITPNDYFPLSRTGPAPGEPVIVTGHPGSTDREYTVAQLATMRDQTLLDALLFLSQFRGVLTEYRTKGPEEARKGGVTLRGIENGYKGSRGRLATLLDDGFFERKKSDEQALRRFVDASPALASTTSGAWDAIADAEKVQRVLAPPRSMIEQGGAFNSAYYFFARALVRGAAERAKPNAERLPEFNDSQLPQVEGRLMSGAPIYADFEKLKLTFSLTRFREVIGNDAPIVKQVLGKDAPATLAADMIDHTRLGDPAIRRALWDGGAAAIAASDDPFIRLVVRIDPEARAIRARYEREVAAVVQSNTEKIAQARFAMLGDAIYPDATFTLRMSYGRVEGWNEAGAAVPPLTNLGGAFERATGADPYELPPSWLARRDKLDLKTPFNFSSTLDSTGGNSGSPILNRRGELVGLLFDGNIHSLGGAFWYDASRNRSVAVDSAAILEALDKVYDAKVLTRELSAH